jgi:undecaprenol kinase
VVVLGVALRVSAPEWCVLVLAIALVLTAEALNTSIESAIVYVSSRVPRARRTPKDVAAGAVLIAALARSSSGCWCRPHLGGSAHSHSPVSILMMRKIDDRAVHAPN